MIKFIDPNEEPFFEYSDPKHPVKCNFTENLTNETCPINPAIDLKNDKIYYYLHEGSKSINV